MFIYILVYLSISTSHGSSVGSEKPTAVTPVNGWDPEADSPQEHSICVPRSPVMCKGQDTRPLTLSPDHCPPADPCWRICSCTPSFRREGHSGMTSRLLGVRPREDGKLNTCGQQGRPRSEAGDPKIIQCQHPNHRIYYLSKRMLF